MELEMEQGLTNLEFKLFLNLIYESVTIKIPTGMNRTERTISNRGKTHGPAARSTSETLRIQPPDRTC